MVAGPHRSHGRADRLDHARALVAEDDRQRIGERALDHLEVGVAEAAGAHLDQHVAGLERRHVERVEGQRLADLVENRGAEFHGCFGDLGSNKAFASGYGIASSWKRA